MLCKVHSTASMLCDYFHLSYVSQPVCATFKHLTISFVRKVFSAWQVGNVRHFSTMSFEMLERVFCQLWVTWALTGMLTRNWLSVSEMLDSSRPFKMCNMIFAFISWFWAAASIRFLHNYCGFTPLNFQCCPSKQSILATPRRRRWNCDLPTLKLNL